MSDRDLIRAWMDEAEDTLTYDEETLPPPAIGDATLQQLDGYIAATLTQLAALKQVKTWLDTEMIARLGNRDARFGDWIYRTRPTTEYKVKEDKKRDFWTLVRLHDFAERLFNPNQARKTALRDLGEQYLEADPETGEIVAEGFTAFVQDFLDVQEKEGLSRVPLERAPKFLQKLADGETT